jgi:hypothetical protein
VVKYYHLMRTGFIWLRLIFATSVAIPAVSLFSPQEKALAAVPSRQSTSPVDNATSISPTTDLTITFNIPVSRGTGLIELKKVNNPFAVQTFDVATSSALSGWGTSTITVDLSILSENTDYFVNYSSTAFRDGTTSDYATALSGNTTWNFRTSGVPWDSGNGTVSTPWVITSCLELISIDANTAYWDDYFDFGNNIDCSGATVFPMRIGTGSDQFTGKIDGNGFTISNLTVTCPADYGCGLFAKVSSGASFSNLNLNTVTINQTSTLYYLAGSLFGAQSGTASSAINISNVVATDLNISNANSFSGGIAGDCATCVATNISTAGNISGKTTVGGIFGRLGSSSSTAATLSNSSSSATIIATMNSTSSTQSAGGLLGSYVVSSSATEANRTLSNLTFSGSVTGDSLDIGGIVGDADNAKFEGVTSTGTVTGHDDVGGIVGDLSSSTIVTSRSSGTVHATRSDNCSGQVGGLVGTFSLSTVSKSYSTATVKGHCRIGGLIGGATPNGNATFLENSYFVGSLVQIATGTYAGSSMGGLIGVTNATATIAKSYAVITSATNASSQTFKGLIGSRYSGSQTITCTSVYWDKEVTSVTTDGACTSTLGKPTSDMKTQSTFSGFDFSNDWQIVSAVNSGYPILRAFSHASVPTAPTITSISGGDGTLAVNFSAGSDGGSPISNYKYSTDGTNYVALSPPSTSNPLTITGLSNGTTYSVTIKAVNSVGDSLASNSGSGTPTSSDSTAPSAPNTPDLAAGSDSGQSSTDELTNDNTPTISVTAAEAGGTVTVTATKTGETNVTCTLTGSTSGGTCDLGILIDGTWSITARHADAAGNSSSPSSALSITIDTTAPTATLFNPNSSTNNSRRPTLTARYSENVYAGTGSLLLTQGGSTIESFLASAIEISTDTVTITPTVILAAGLQHIVTIPSGFLTDLAGNATAAVTSGTWGFITSSDGTAPVATWTEPSSPSSSRTLSYSLVFTESVSGLAGADFSITGTATGCSVSPSATAGTSFMVTVVCSTNGTVIVSIGGNAVRDSVGNEGPSSAVSAAGVTINAVATTAPPATTSTTVAPTTRTLSISGAAARYIVTQDGPGLTAVPSVGGGAISWSSLTPSVCSVSTIAMMSVLSAQSSVSVGRLSVVGTCTISAVVAATSTHSSASTSVSFTVTRARPTVTVSTFDDEHFFAKITLPSAIASSSALLRSMYDDLTFVSLTPETCEIDVIATFQESASEFGSSWIGLHGRPDYNEQGACTVRAELPLGDRWFRVFSNTNATLGEDLEPTPTTVAPTTTARPTTATATTTTTVVTSSSSTVVSTTTVASSETTGPAPSITSFGPTSSIASVPLLELDVERQIVLDNGETEIVFTRESLIRTAENVGVRVGAIRLRTASSAWTETKLPDATDLRLVIRQADAELRIEVAPEVGEVIRIAVPIVVTIESGFELRNFTIAFLAGAVLMAWWLLVWRRRRREDQSINS